MQSNQLESLESVAYSKLAEFIQSERLQEALFLVDIICRVPQLAQSGYKSFLTSTMNNQRIAAKVNNIVLDNSSSDFIGNSNYTPYNYASVQSNPFVPTKDTASTQYDSLMPSIKLSEYKWTDGSKDPREDYWRDG